MSVDPLADRFAAYSPYNYVLNNPVKLIDPDGRAPTDWYKNLKTGSYTWFNGSGKREGYQHIGGKGSLLGEFEQHINDIHPKSGLTNGIYSEGFTLDISSNDKGALLPTDGDGSGNFLDEFINSKGPMVSVMLGDHPYTNGMKDASSVESARQFMKDGKNTVAGQLNNWEGSFPWYSGPIKAGFDIAEQFVGSFRLDVLPNQSKNNSMFIISDSKSRSSLFYHAPVDNVSRTSSSSMNFGMGNTYQYYLWKEKTPQESTGGGTSW